MVSRFCYFYDLKFEDFWKWKKPKNASDENYKKLDNTWCYKLRDFSTVNIQQIILILEKYYPGINNKKEVNDFVKMCDISDVKYIEVERLEQEHFYKGKNAKFSILVWVAAKQLKLWNM